MNGLDGWDDVRAIRPADLAATLQGSALANLESDTYARIEVTQLGA